MVNQIYKIVLCLIVFIPLIISADETVVDEKKIEITDNTNEIRVVDRDEIQRISNKTDENVSRLRGRISNLESEIRKLKSEISSLRHRLGVAEDSLGI